MSQESVIHFYGTNELEDKTTLLASLLKVCRANHIVEVERLNMQPTNDINRYNYNYTYIINSDETPADVQIVGRNIPIGTHKERLAVCRLCQPHLSDG